ncbi:MAG: hypothetical protein ACR2OA_05520 [Rubripirellula sp.]
MQLHHERVLRQQASRLFTVLRVAGLYCVTDSAWDVSQVLRLLFIEIMVLIEETAV